VKILITGAKGQLGQELVKLYPNAIATDSTDLDITNISNLEKFDWSNIKLILNAAAYTKVDDAEQPENIPIAWKVNAIGPANLASIAKKKNIILVHISSEYVFDGTKSDFYSEVDQPNPEGIYARTKASGDLAISSIPNHYIVRTSWVIGQGHNFVKTMLKLGREKGAVSVVNDQKGRPTFAKDLASAIKHLIDSNSPYGIYNFTNSGEVVSWYEFTKHIFKTASIKCMVNPSTTDDYAKTKKFFAPRPKNSTLDLSKIEDTGLHIRNWEDALLEYIKKEQTT
jgi:dTDP-4-dehydrorhamnose 3,5-epimerase/reductase